MAHFAEIDENNIVLRVLAVPNEHENRGQQFLSNDLGLGGTWLRTSYNTHANEHAAGGSPFRFNYAGIGYTFDPTLGPDGGFIPPQPFPSWTLNRGTGTWRPPAPMPQQGLWEWDEENLSWVEVIP